MQSTQRSGRQGSGRQESRIKIDNTKTFAEPPIIQQIYTKPPLNHQTYTQPPITQSTFNQTPVVQKKYVELPKSNQKSFTGFNNIEHKIVKRLWQTTKKADLSEQRSKKTATGNENYRERAMSEKVLHSV